MICIYIYSFLSCICICIRISIHIVIIFIYICLCLYLYLYLYLSFAGSQYVCVSAALSYSPDLHLCTEGWEIYRSQSACKGVGGWYSFYFPTCLVSQNNSALFSNFPEQMRDYQELQYTPGERQPGSILHKNMSRHLSTWPWRQQQTIFVFNPLVSDLGNTQTFRDHLGCRYLDVPVLLCSYQKSNGPPGLAI